MGAEIAPCQPRALGDRGHIRSSEGPASRRVACSDLASGRRRKRGSRDEPPRQSCAFDDTPPALAFQRPDRRPARLSSESASDGPGFGPGSAGDLRATARFSGLDQPARCPRSQAGFSAFIDDEKLPDGVYELRARAVDLAGNERSTDRLCRRQAAPSSRLPLRIKTTLRVGRPTRVRARGARWQDGATGSSSWRAPRARYGRTIPLRGRLTSPGGNPLAGREVQVLEQTKLACRARGA